MASKKNFSLGRKLKEHNYCYTCGEECKAVKFAKTKYSKRAGMWYVCVNDHVNKSRICEYK